MDIELELAYARLHLVMAIDEWAAREHDVVHQAANHLHRSLGQQFRFLRERLTRLPANHPHEKFRRFVAIGYTPPVTSTLFLTPHGTSTLAGGMVISAAASEFLKETLRSQPAVHTLEDLAR